MPKRQKSVDDGSPKNKEGKTPESTVERTIRKLEELTAEDVGERPPEFAGLKDHEIVQREKGIALRRAVPPEARDRLAAALFYLLEGFWDHTLDDGENALRLLQQHMEKKRANN